MSDVRFVFLITSLFVPLPDRSLNTNALFVTFTNGASTHTGFYYSACFFINLEKSLFYG